MKLSYTLEELKQIITLRVDCRFTWEEVSEHTGISTRNLKEVSPLLNQYRPCKACHRPVALFRTTNKEFCSNVCYYNHYRTYVTTVEEQDLSFMGHKFSLNKEQIVDALIRRYEFNEDLKVIAEDMNVSLSTLSRTLLAVGGKSLKLARKHECIICLKPFTGQPQAKYCSGKCRTIGYRTGIAKSRKVK